MCCRTIGDLPEALVSLPASQRALLDRVFRISATRSLIAMPSDQRTYLERQGLSEQDVEDQLVVKVTNTVTWDGAIISPFRAKRYMEQAREGRRSREERLRAVLNEELPRHEFTTFEDTFGVVRGAYCHASANMARMDCRNSVLLFDEQDPLQFTEGQIADYLGTAEAWGARAVDADATAPYFFLMWNCLWKSGAGTSRGHMQMTMTGGMHYARIEHLRRAALGYRASVGSDYFQDLFEIHRILGLEARNQGGARVVAHLAPIKEKEVLILAADLGPPTAHALNSVLRAYVTKLGVQTFNVAVWMPPLGSTPEEDWSGFPVLIRVVDRGDLFNRAADVGAMELYAQSVVASDPFLVAEAL
jgi:hypothetical protein